MALLLFVCVLFWGAHKSLAPGARTLLGVLGHATLKFFAVAILLFFFCECPKFCDPAKQLRKILLGGFLRLEKTIFRFFFFWLCVFFLVFSSIQIGERIFFVILSGGRLELAWISSEETHSGAAAMTQSQN